MDFYKENQTKYAEPQKSYSLPDKSICETIGKREYSDSRRLRVLRDRK